MNQTSFGKRNAPAPHWPAPRPAVRPFEPAPRTIAPAEAYVSQPTARDYDSAGVTAEWPLATIGLIAFLLALYGLQTHLAFDTNPDGGLSLRSLISQGASGYELVVGEGEWWRLFLAPLLHGSMSHVIGNCVALFFAGFRLEPFIGRGWFIGIFALSAVAGGGASILNNPAGMVSVGASGAICGVVAALFAASFHFRADLDQQSRMRRVALFFGIPSLLPLLFASGGSVDYWAHGGGALMGFVCGMALSTFMGDDDLHAQSSLGMTVAAALFAVLGMSSAAIAASDFDMHRARASELAPARDLPKIDKVDGRRTAQLIVRYPRDPQSHLLHAVHLADTGNLVLAERHLQTAMNLARDDRYSGRVKDLTQIIMAVVLASQKRLVEARRYARDYCDKETEQPQLRKELHKLQLCDSATLPQSLTADRPRNVRANGQ